MSKDNERQRARRRKSLQELVSIAEDLSPWRKTNERVRVTAQPKRRNEYRFICAHGTQMRGLQTLLRRSREAGVEYNPAQFSVAGRGVARAAAEDLARAIAEGSCEFAIKFDAQNCYPSLTFDGVARTLGLLPQVVQNVAMVRTHAMDISSPGNVGPRVSVSTEGLRGIAQGSLVSPTIAHLVLKPLLEHGA